MYVSVSRVSYCRQHLQSLTDGTYCAALLPTALHTHRLVLTMHDETRPTHRSHKTSSAECSRKDVIIAADHCHFYSRKVGSDGLLALLASSVAALAPPLSARWLPLSSCTGRPVTVRWPAAAANSCHAPHTAQREGGRASSCQ